MQNGSSTMSFRANANGSARGTTDDRLRIEPETSRFPDLQLYIGGPVQTHHAGMTMSASLVGAKASELPVAVRLTGD
jgi:hypothetical protein